MAVKMSDFKPSTDQQAFVDAAIASAIDAQTRGQFAPEALVRKYTEECRVEAPHTPSVALRASPGLLAEHFNESGT